MCAEAAGGARAAAGTTMPTTSTTHHAHLVLAAGQRVGAEAAQHSRVGALLVGRTDNQAMHAQAAGVSGRVFVGAG
jgi:hypothetical protein